MNDQRLDVRKTYKLYVGGQFVRSESGRAPHAKIATAAKGKQHRIPVDPYSPATLSMNRLLQGVPPSGGRTSGRLKPGLRASSRRSWPQCAMLESWRLCMNRSRRQKDGGRKIS